MYKKELTREDKLVMELTGKYMDARENICLTKFKPYNVAV